MTPPPWSFDSVTDDLISAYVRVVSLISGWGVLSSGAVAVYPSLSLPFPAEPFPSAYIYLAGQTGDQLQGTGTRKDITSVNVRILGGPATPDYKFNAEHKTYQMLTPVKNVLSYYRYLEDVSNNNTPFRYIAPENKVTIGNVGRIQAFSYEGVGKFIGIEVPTTVGLLLNVGRAS